MPVTGARDRLVCTTRYRVRRHSPIELLVHLLRDQGDLLTQIVRETTTSVDRIEDQLLSQRLSDNRAELSSMRRVLVRLLNRPPEWLQEQDLRQLRAATEEFTLVISDLTALGERIKLLQEEIAAKLNEQTNRTLFTLTVVTV